MEDTERTRGGGSAPIAPSKIRSRATTYVVPSASSRSGVPVCRKKYWRRAEAAQRTPADPLARPERAGGTGATPPAHSCPSFGCENATSPSDEQRTVRRRRASARRPPDTTHTCLRWARAAGVFFRSDFRGALFTARKNAGVRGSSSDSHAYKPTGAPENYSEPAVLASDCVSDS